MRWASFSTRIIPFQTTRELVLEAPLVEQVAGGVVGDVILPGEVGQVLAAGREHDAVDLGIGPRPGQHDLLVDLGQPRAQAADGPLQRGIAADHGPLPAEVPGGVVPVLDVDQPEPCAPAPGRPPGARVERRRPPPPRPAVSRTRVASAPSSSTTRVWLRSTLPALRQADQAEQRGLDLHPLGHVEQRPARPERRVQRREEVVARGNGLGQQVSFEELGVILDRAVQVDEDRAAQLRRVGLAGQGAVDVAMPVAYASSRPSNVVEGGEASALGSRRRAARRRRASARGYRSAAIPPRARRPGERPEPANASRRRRPAMRARRAPS